MYAIRSYYVSDTFAKNPEVFEQEAAKITNYLRQQRIPGYSNAEQSLNVDDLKAAFNIV